MEKTEILNKNLIELNRVVKNSIKEIQEASSIELVALRDESRGLNLELHSCRISVDKLLILAQQGFNFLENQRTIKLIPHMIN